MVFGGKSTQSRFSSSTETSFYQFFIAMSDRELRSCILDLLRLTKAHSVKLRRRCNEQWCNELRHLQSNTLLRRLKYILWWAPLRAIAATYNRGLLRGQRVLTCVFEELQRRGVEEAPIIRGLVGEIRSYRQLHDATSDEESAFVEVTRDVEDAKLAIHAEINLPQQINHDEIGRGGHEESGGVASNIPAPLILNDESYIQTGGGRTRNTPRDESFGDVQPPGDRIFIIRDTACYFKRFKLRGRETTIRIRQPPPGVSVTEWLEGAFRDLLTHLTRCCEGSDYAGITFTTNSLAHGPVWLSFRPVRDYTFEDIWHLITSVAQSTSSLNIDDSFNIKTCIVKGVEGSGRKGLTHEGVAKKSILTIRNTDNLCLPRSLVTARVYAERGEMRSGPLHARWQRIRRINHSFQKEAALELTASAGVIVPKHGCGVREIALYQDYLARDGFAIVVFEFLTLGRREAPLFDGTQRVLDIAGAVQHTLYILYYERSCHFQPILNLRGAVGSLNFCVTCNARFRGETHRCLKKKCPRCFQAPPCSVLTVNTVRCQACNRDFFGEVCLQNHRVITSRRGRRVHTVCEFLKRCRNCFRAVKPLKKKPHTCGVGFCKTCKIDQPYNHLCFMAPVRTDSTRKKNIFIFYDFETQQCESVEGDPTTIVHRPNLCVAQRVCTLCCDTDCIAEPCEHCGTHEFIFKTNPVRQLVELGMQSIAGFSQTILIAHNAGGFDAQFILRYLIEEKKTQLPTLIMNGTKIITMRLGKLVFLDSLHYFHMPLSALPKAFGLKGALVKGSFPHLFNKPENQNYVGPLPSINYYSPDTMHEAENERFTAWYNELKSANYAFDFSKEIVDYCKNDVTILRQACVVFRQIFMNSGRVCPFSENTTIASACFQIFRKNFLKNNSIGIIPTWGYRWTHNQSKKAVSWLVWLEHSLGRKIIHAGRSREFKLPQNLMVDGYYETPDAAHVLQFHGCYWHGCPRCFAEDRDRKQSDGISSMSERFEKTNAISYRIRTGGYVLTEIWECEYDRMVETCEEMSAFVRNHPLVKEKPLNPRDAFFGGRTENMVTLYDVRDGEQIRYVDVCSLYPYVCKYGKYPVGHPKVYVGDECIELTGPNNNDLSRVEGLVKCTVLAPQNLYHPVLPARMHQRLLFALCRSCCEVMNQGMCTHEDPEKRVFNGTWVVDELRKAIACGYKVIRVAEIWQYEITQYNPHTKEGGLFTEYINTFLKIKQEASGWPEDCVQDTSAQDHYIASFENTESIKLNRDAIAKNPGLRSVAKLCLNSFWGKFGQRENLPRTTIVSTRAKLMELLSGPEYAVTGMLPVNNNVLYVSYTNVDDAVTPSSIANAVVAAYTTAQARLKLYSYLELLGRRALYCDTDSVIYTTTNNPNEYEPPTGQFLGDLTDELESYGAGSYIKSFVSGGPKFYSFIVSTVDGTESEVCKVKGITLNFANSSLINYESVRSFIVGEREEPVVLEYDAIRRTAFHQVITRRETKSCRPSSVKRRRDGEYDSLPYGYKD